MSIIKSGYKRQSERDLRPITIAEAKRLTGHATVIDLHGNWRTVKVTSVKTWKTRPDDVDVHYKYGMYEYGITEYRGSIEPMSGPTFVTDK